MLLTISKIYHYLVLLLILLGKTCVSANDDISNHVRKCCVSGLRHARTNSHCKNHEYEVSAIPPLWRGLCVSTYGVCCSREVEKQHCVAGRLAALTGSRCNDSEFNTTSYADCCRSCQVGLAVKASENDCNDILFSYFTNIESYRICCDGGSGATEDAKDSYDGNHTSKSKEYNHKSYTVLKDDDVDNNDGYIDNEDQNDKHVYDRDFVGDSTENAGDDIIVLRENDDDICSKVKNLCGQICENTNESYRCKCNPGFKLDDNQVTCTASINFGDDLVHNSTTKTQTTEHVELGNYMTNNKENEINATDTDNDNEDNINRNEYHIDATTCPDGYEKDMVLNKCVDINECATKVQNNCYNVQYCHNTVGSYRCLNIKPNCDEGYQYDIKTTKCKDIDECNNFPCDKGYTCINHPGRYECSKLVVTHPHDVSHVTAHREMQIFLEDDFNSKNSNTASIDNCGNGFLFKDGYCQDIDECAADENVCDSSQICTNDIGDYHCDCKIGFNLDATSNVCVDINECSINNHNCLSSQRCDNTVGSYICTRLQSCGTGYTLNAETGNCDDDDECSLNTHNCTPDYECYNTKGSFRCYRRPPSTTTTTTTTSSTTTTTSTTSRPSTQPQPQAPEASILSPSHGIYPYYHNNSGTQYYNPSYASHQTHSHAYYPPSNYIGSEISTQQLYSRVCDTGFYRNSLGACVDLNECITNNPCGSHQRCINTNGSYRCLNLLQCAAGYKSTRNGSSCIDIDECDTGEHNCAENQICRNRNGGYICSCPPGHQLARLSESINRCVDIDECQQEHPLVCPSNAQCLNTIGSYYCECKSGYQKSRDSDRICLDVDECQEIPGLCQQKCVNFWGGYRCSCYTGYELSADNRTCTDVDECEVHKAYKLCMGFCNNVPGSYECSCPRGYTLSMDRNTCRDIDECFTGDVCTGRNDICTNMRGTYRCTTTQCPYGYVNDPDQKNRCRQTSNMCEGDECYNKPSAYTYNFITLVSKLIIPPEGRIIFSLRGPLWYDDIDFDLKIVKIQVAANIEKASDNHFETIKSKHEVHLSLKRSLEGPQDIELELSMTVFTNGMPRGKSVAKIFILVSQYTF